MKKSQSRLDWLCSLRDDEISALEKLDVARANCDPLLQMQALKELQRIYIDFAFSEYLITVGVREYTIDYSYYSEWKNNGEIKTIHSEIE